MELSGNGHLYCIVLNFKRVVI